VSETEAGEEIIIAKAGKPVARLMPLKDRKVQRQPGLMKGKIWMSDDFDAPLPPDLLKAFGAIEIE
jgi:antitoxin (DNA-binding transcriptional repressor) of toxin-antitoxin stability system